MPQATILYIYPVKSYQQAHKILTNSILYKKKKKTLGANVNLKARTSHSARKKFYCHRMENFNHFDKWQKFLTTER